MSRSRKFFVTLLCTCWIPIGLAVAAVWFQSMRIASMTTVYMAVGKVAVLGSPDASPGAPGGTMAAAGKIADQDFFGTQIEILQSGELRRRALERVRSLHPELKEIDVGIKVTRTKGSGILNVAALGEEAKFTRVYLDELLTEYIAFRRDMLDKSVASAMNKVIAEVLSREKQISQLAKQNDAFVAAHDFDLMQEEHGRLIKRMSALRDEIDQQKAAPATDASGSEKAKALAGSLQEAEKAYATNAETLQLHSVKSRELDKAKMDYETWKDTLNRMEVSDVANIPKVAIMERPSIAVEEVPQLGAALTVWGTGGFGIGCVFAVIISSLVAWTAPVPPPSPQPLPPPL